MRLTLIVLLLTGVAGCDPTPKENFEARLKATEQGDAKAQYNLGLMHGRGKGVPENYLTRSCAVLFALVIGVAGEVQHA